jgi:hypothetical protein
MVHRGCAKVSAPAAKPEPIQPEDRLAYAVSLLRGAQAIGAVGHGQGRRLVQPFFLLICFALENGLKAYLQHGGVDQTERIDRPPLAHDLKRLTGLAIKTGLALPENSSKLIDSLSEYHLQHQFRYPKNAGIVEIFSNEFANAWTDEALKNIAVGIGYIP